MCKRACELAKILSPDDKSRVLQKIAHKYCDNSDFNKAFELAKTIPDRMIRGCVLYVIARSLHERGRYDEVTTVLKELSWEKVQEFRRYNQVM